MGRSLGSLSPAVDVLGDPSVTSASLPSGSVSAPIPSLLDLSLVVGPREPPSASISSSEKLPMEVLVTNWCTRSSSNGVRGDSGACSCSIDSVTEEWSGYQMSDFSSTRYDLLLYSHIV
eukprot:CAMPEP_0116864702 /NCGR_PEP_ID=MMETSP0418-20121206/24975_1 /TAXON_ID=1158023 /ORGANISM="Astrosyne radiata, Strain 13vi08-1A" /LENGTH=118 /DNA_ID=CAMNT_0004499965 /DNA_START=190 /DNA_END=546 /DNA_ORIENTATION=-